MTSLQINVLGTMYGVERVPYETDAYMFANGLSGYCEHYAHHIKVLQFDTHPDYKDDAPETIAAAEKETIRHEIIHAFLYESGLAQNSATIDAWATNEEMVDWLAIQLPKIIQACRDADAL